MKIRHLAILAATVAFSFHTLHAAPILRITEVMSSSGSGGTEDWFEITNVGDEAIDITGFKMDDNSFSSGASAVLNGVTTIAPSESVVMVEDASTTESADAFRTFWEIDPSVQVGWYSGGGVSFSSGGDGTAIFTSTGTEITRVTFGGATAGSTFYYVYSSIGTILSSGSPVSTAGSLGAFSTSGLPVNTGSPGTAAASLDLAFTSGVKRFATTGKTYSSPVTFQKQNGTDVVTLSLVSGPAWLSLTGVTQTGGTLSGTPGSTNTGPQSVTLRLEVTGQDPVEQTAPITVFAAQPKVVLNEFNGVADNEFHASLEGDLRLGRIEGNGGDWFELVVVGSGGRHHPGHAWLENRRLPSHRRHPPHRYHHSFQR